ncbi:MAG: DUF1343 domain-containing protein [Puniceicoccales bacterium]|jgi:uncharacterized protein YbbC (DUF1343 family)|nr:DUF1343 domain-containing protein [Puniceicoccales bacterium]
MFRRDFIQRLTLTSVSVAAGVVSTHGRAPLPVSPRTARVEPLPQVALGIDVLAGEKFARLHGLRVGLVTHPAGVNARGEKTIDVLRHASGVRLVKLYGPEHGIYGDAPANAPVQNALDRRTGLPVFSLYGKTRRPTPEMLEGLDVMLVDLQDIGSRSYTYVSCMRHVLEACFDAGVKVIILDRPNPLGGLKVDGPGLDKKWMSYVGFFQVPYVHGLTIGELALAATRTPGWLNLSDAGRKGGQLEVIKMRGWHRSMRWRDTGLRWIGTSPMIPQVEAAEGYAMTGLGCQAGGFTHGTLTQYPFRFLQFPGKRASEVEQALRTCGVRGLGLSSKRLRDGTEGVYLSITDWSALCPTEISFHMMQLACRWNAQNPFIGLTNTQEDLFKKQTGSEAFLRDLQKYGASANIGAWLARWNREAQAFQEWARRFWIYRS